MMYIIIPIISGGFNVIMKKRHIIISTLLLALNIGFMTGFAAESSTLPVSATETVVEGDCNGDGQFSADDAMLLQKWLIGSGQLNNRLNGDLNGDSFIDSFDLTLMRQKLTEQIEHSFETEAGYSLLYIKSGGEVTVTGFVKTSEAESVNVEIPDSIDGCPVTTIGAFAFNNSAISDVIIPDSVVSLGDYAFASCPNLKTVTLSKNLSTELSGGYLFTGSNSIETVYLPSEMTDPTFIEHFNYHTTTTLQGSYKSSDYTFSYKIINRETTVTGLSNVSEAETVNVEIPDNIYGYPVTAIGAYVFQNTFVTDVTIPDSVVSLGKYSFAHCSNLRSVTLSKNLSTELSGEYLFYDTPNLLNIYASGNMTDPTFIDHFNYHTDSVISGTFTTAQYDLIYSLPVADSAVTITGYISSGAENITVDIPDTIHGRPVTTIGAYAFNGSDIYEIIFHNNLTTIEYSAFGSCKKLTKVTLSKNLSHELSGGYLFTGCDQLSEIAIPDGITDSDFLEHFQYCEGGAKLFKSEIDAKVSEVYNDLKSSNSSINWNISGSSGQSREDAKYETAKYIHSQLAGNLINYDDTSPLHQTAYSIIEGRGACAGMSRSYILLLLEAGFTEDEIQLISAPAHALVGIKLYDQWYFVECTANVSKFFCMTYQNEWYRGTPEGEYNGYIIPETYSFYLDCDGTRVANEESEAELSQIYKSNYNRGDVNMDGATDSKDYSVLANYLNGDSVSINLVNADVNYDGIIDSTDLSVINSISIGEMNFMDIVIENYGKPF